MKPQNDNSRRLIESSKQINIEHVLTRYDALLLDAYGVLVDKSGALPGAASLIDRLNATDHAYLVLTNSASRSPATMARDFAQLGLNIAPEKILTSGALLAPYFREHGLTGAPCVVLGTAESTAYVSAAGGLVVPLDESVEAEVVVIADQKGFALMESMDQLLSLVIRRMDHSQNLHLVLCNPDIIYPVSMGRYGFTAGGLAAMLEAVLNERYAKSDAWFVRLGKPHTPIFEEAIKRLNDKKNLVMVGDQLATDILGANRLGLDSVLVGTGLAQSRDKTPCNAVPTWFIESLS